MFAGRIERKHRMKRFAVYWAWLLPLCLTVLGVLARPHTALRLQLCLTVLSLLACPHTAWSQVSAAISGRVEDASGSPITGATVTVSDLETGAIRTVFTDSNGNYRVLSLQLGLHEVKAEKEGFKAAIRTGIKLEVGQLALVNLRLEVGQVVQQIVVSEEAPVINTTTRL